MKRYSAFAIAREATRYHSGWERAWRAPEPKTKYDAIIIGAGGHGLATAYYLGKNFGITNVAIIEKGWLGGGNTGRNTTIIRSNYLQDPSAAIYEKSRSLYETMSQDLNYNVMFSPRGVIMLAQTHHEVRGYQRTAHANALQGVPTEWINPQRVKELCPIINLEGPRYPVLGGLWQARGGTARHDAVAWGYARACSDMGMDVIQQCEVTNIRREGGKVVGVDTTKGAIDCDKLGIVVAGHSGDLANMAGFRLPLRIRGPTGVGVRADQTGNGRGHHGQHCARLPVTIRQGRNGHRRRDRWLQQLYPTWIVPPCGGNGTGVERDLPDAVTPQNASPMGWDCGRHRGPLPDPIQNTSGRRVHQLWLGHWRVQSDPRVWLGHGRADGQRTFAPD